VWNREADAEESFRDKAIWWSAGLIIVAAIGVGAYFRYFAKPAAAPPVQQVQAPAPAPQASTEPEIRNPVPEVPPAEAAPLPPVNQSDSLLHDTLAGMVGQRPVEQFLVPENIVRHIVVTIDNLPRKKVAVDLRPIKPTPGQTSVSSQGDITTLSADNYARYEPFIKLVQSTDAKTLATVYFRLYPLFQQAYEDLGYPGKYFNDRLVEVIDHLLATPDVQGPIELVQPKVFYQYADPSLEELSAGQKVLIRMGPANARAIKAKLRDFRAEIVKKKQ
jgi:hypothetical protein